MKKNSRRIVDYDRNPENRRWKLRLTKKSPMRKIKIFVRQSFCFLNWNFFLTQHFTSREFDT